MPGSAESEPLPAWRLSSKAAPNTWWTGLALNERDRVEITMKTDNAAVSNVFMCVCYTVKVRWHVISITWMQVDQNPVYLNCWNYSRDCTYKYPFGQKKNQDRWWYVEFTKALYIRLCIRTKKQPVRMHLKQSTNHSSGRGRQMWDFIVKQRMIQKVYWAKI